MPLEFQIDYTPTKKQRMFHETDADEVLFGGAAGGGKSKAIVMDAFLRCLKFPHTHAFIFRRTYGELEDTIIKEAKESYPIGIYKYNGGRHEMALLNGSMIHFRHCASPADMYNYKGAEIQWLYFDELTSFEFEIYDFLKTRLRAKKSLGVVPVVRSSSNPGDIGHGWVKKMFVDAAPYMQIFTREIVSKATGKKKVFRMQYIPSLVTENPFIGDDYIFQLESKPEALRNALLYGDWNAFEGQVFTEWVDDPEHYDDRIHTHVINPFPIPASWPRYMSFDHGFSRPFSCGWWAVAPDGRAYRYKEWYGCEKGAANVGLKLSPKQIAEGILRMEADSEALENIKVDRIADPAIFDRSRGDSVAQMMEPTGGHKGVYFRQGDNTRLAGKMQVHERLRFDADGRPMMYIFKNCVDFIRTIPTLPYSLTKPEDIDTDAEDHCLTADTMVRTANGWERIDTLSDGEVLSHDGKFHRFSDCRKTQTNVDVFTLVTDDGKEVTATANHRFMLADGTWKRLDELKTGDELKEVF